MCSVILREAFGGVSSGSWLHIDASGAAARRFNLDVGSPNGAVAAINPTRLAVVSSDPVGGGGVVEVFDTETMSWELMHRDERPLGDVAVSGQDVLFVAYENSAAAMFTVVRLPLDAATGPVEVTTPLPAVGLVAIDADDNGTIYAAAGEKSYVFAADGRLEAEVAARSTNPAVSVNGRGDVLWSQEGPPQDLSSFIAGGSGEARTVIERHTGCASLATRAPVDYLSLVTTDTTVVMPFLCAPAGMTWITDEEFVVSVGDEGGAPLVRVTPPGG